MTHEMAVIKAELEAPGRWIVELDCGCKYYQYTRKDCKKFPKKRFCSVCWSRDQPKIKEI